jgi:predicted RNA-binding Zn-ribbon protein involved in translation (DUF1610 family)
VRFWLKWSSVSFCVLLLLSWGISLYWSASYCGGSWSIVVSSGEVAWTRSHCRSFRRGWEFRPTLINLTRTAPQIEYLVRLPGHVSRPLYEGFWVPLWIPSAALAILAISCFVWPHRHGHGYCQQCGYDLTGNVSGRCPECGEAVQPRSEQLGAAGDSPTSSCVRDNGPPGVPVR